MQLRSIVGADLRRTGRRGSVASAAKAIIADAGFLAVLLYRLQYVAQAKGSARMAKSWSRINLALTGAEFVPGAQIGPGLLVRHPVGIVVGGGAVIGDSCTLLQNVTIGEREISRHNLEHHYPRLGDSVIVGAGACILGPIVVGSGATIGALSLVNRDVAPDQTVVGIPARPLGAA